MDHSCWNILEKGWRTRSIWRKAGGKQGGWQYSTTYKGGWKGKEWTNHFYWQCPCSMLWGKGIIVIIHDSHYHHYSSTCIIVQVESSQTCICHLWPNWIHAFPLYCKYRMSSVWEKKKLKCILGILWNIATKSSIHHQKVSWPSLSHQCIYRLQIQGLGRQGFGHEWSSLYGEASSCW